jgi:hypothetical protein
MDADRSVEMLVLKCISDQTGEDLDEVRAAGFVDLNDLDYVGVIHRIEAVFDCTLDLLGSPERRLAVADLCARIPRTSIGTGGYA